MAEAALWFLGWWVQDWCSEGAHVRRELCVVFGGGCACVTWTRVCLCTWGDAFQDGVVCEQRVTRTRVTTVREGVCACLEGVRVSRARVTWLGGGSQDCVSASASLCLGQVQGVIEAHSCVLENPRDFQGWVFFASLPLPSHVHCGSDCSRPYYLLLGSPSSVLTPGLRLILNLIQLNCFPA